jgi:hypothetical protein
MTAAEKSYMGLAKQTAYGTPNVTDASFSYFLFSEGSLAPNNVVLPTDQEVGGGALLNDVQKVGVSAAGAFTFIPRATSLGHFLMGVLGADTSTLHAGGTLAYDHVMKLPADQFSAPYYTFRSNPGGMWGEQFQDVRIAALALNWRAADYLRAQVALQGGLPTPNVSTAAWSPSAKVDRGASFIAPKATITWPSATPKVLGGSISFGAAIPLDEQWITGSYSPDGLDITNRAASISFSMKVADKVLYDKMAYDPADGAAWVASIFKEADITVEFDSPTIIESSTPYSLKVAFNASVTNPNVAWSVAPIALRAGRQVLMAATGTILQSAVADGDPITVTLVNKQSAAY